MTLASIFCQFSQGPFFVSSSQSDFNISVRLVLSRLTLCAFVRAGGMMACQLMATSAPNHVISCMCCPCVYIRFSSALSSSVTWVAPKRERCASRFWESHPRASISTRIILLVSRGIILLILAIIGMNEELIDSLCHFVQVTCSVENMEVCIYWFKRTNEMPSPV